MAASEVFVAPLKAEDIAAVRQLLIEGLTARWHEYKPLLNPDIESFPTSYREATILVAKRGERIVGTGTLRKLSAEQAELVRMSVDASCQRSGIGTLILRGLLEAGQQRGFREVMLETTSSWKSAIAFYVGHGFRKTHERDGDTYFLLKLSDA